MVRARKVTTKRSRAAAPAPVEEEAPAPSAPGSSAEPSVKDEAPPPPAPTEVHSAGPASTRTERQEPPPVAPLPRGDGEEKKNGAEAVQQQQQQPAEDAATFWQSAAVRASRPALDYNPYDLHDWGIDGVDTSSAAYREAVSALRKQLPGYLKGALLKGEVLLASVRTALQRRALSEVARQSGYSATNPKLTVCRFVYVRASEHVYLRSGPGNSGLYEEAARQLSRMEIEHRRYMAWRDGAAMPTTPLPGEHARGGSTPPVRSAPLLRWFFTDLFVHREMLEMLRLLACDSGVFRGEPSPSMLELIQAYRVTDAVVDAGLWFPVEVALDARPEWRAEFEAVCRTPDARGEPGLVPFSPRDPYPNVLKADRDAYPTSLYRHFIRPFLFDADPTATLCVTDMPLARDQRPPPVALRIGSAFDLRWGRSASGRVTFHRWMRHSLQLMEKFGPALRLQDERTVGLVYAGLRRRHADMAPAAALRSAKETTLHFGTVNICMASHQLSGELRELQEFAFHEHYNVYVRDTQPGIVCIACTARDFPRLPSDLYKLLFLSTGRFMGPTEMATAAVKLDMGRHADEAVSMAHLLPPSVVVAPAVSKADGSADRYAPQQQQQQQQPSASREGRRRGRSRSPSSSGRDSDGGDYADRRARRHHRHRSGSREERHRSRSREPHERHQPSVAVGNAATAPPTHLPPMVGRAMAQAVAPPASSHLQLQQPQLQPPQPMQLQPQQPMQQQQPVQLQSQLQQSMQPMQPQNFAQSLYAPMQFHQPALPRSASRYAVPPSMPASTFYDAVVGSAQRQCPSGQTVETRVVEWRGVSHGGTASPAPAGPPTAVTFVLDHLRREAVVAPMLLPR